MVQAVGHGGGRHRHHPSTTGRAGRLTDVGLHVLALDVDGHGARPRTPEDEHEVALLQAARRTGEPIGPIVERYNGDLARRTVPEWRALLAGLLAIPEIGDCPVGYWGLTLGTAIGVPLVAEEPLIKAAVFGLFWSSSLIEAARRITVPIEFDLQWEDGLGSPSRVAHRGGRGWLIRRFAFCPGVGALLRSSMKTSSWTARPALSSSPMIYRVRTRVLRFVTPSRQPTMHEVCRS